MESQMKLSEQVTVAGQPDPVQLAELRQKGFKTIFNLRADGEENQPLSPEAEGAAVREHGMEHRHIPVSPDRMKPELVDRFRDELQAAPKPAFVHCGTGLRAGAFSMMDMAVAAGWSGEETLRKAEEMGFECDKPELKQFVSDYIDRKSGDEPGS